MSLYYSTDWLLDLAMLVLFCILAGPAVPVSVNRVYYAGCTALGGIIYYYCLIFYCSLSSKCVTQ